MDAGGLSPAKDKRAKSTERTGCPTCVLLLIDATKGRNKGCFKPGKLLEKECSYIADFVYIQNGNLVVEDTKGFRTEAYKIKRKLMLHVHGIRIKEI